MQIRCFRLITGEDVISKYKREAGKIILEFPVIVAMRNIPGRGLDLLMAPLIATNPEASIELDEDSKIVYSYEGDPHVEAKYIEMTTGLVTAGTPELIKG